MNEAKKVIVDKVVRQWEQIKPPEGMHRFLMHTFKEVFLRNKELQRWASEMRLFWGMIFETDAYKVNRRELMAVLDKTIEANKESYPKQTKQIETIKSDLSEILPNKGNTQLTKQDIDQKNAAVFAVSKEITDDNDLYKCFIRSGYDNRIQHELNNFIQMFQHQPPCVSELNRITQIIINPSDPPIESIDTLWNDINTIVSTIEIEFAKNALTSPLELFNEEHMPKILFHKDSWHYKSKIQSIHKGKFPHMVGIMMSSENFDMQTPITNEDIQKYIKDHPGIADKKLDEHVLRKIKRTNETFQEVTLSTEENFVIPFPDNTSLTFVEPNRWKFS